jgi:Zn-finger protein
LLPTERSAARCVIYERLFEIGENVIQYVAVERIDRQGAELWRCEECGTMHDDWSEETLVQGIRNRDQASLAELIRRHAGELSNFIRSVLESAGTPQDVRECTRDLFATVWQEIGSYDRGCSTFRTWITMRAKYIALERRRQIQRRRRLGQ